MIQSQENMKKISVKKYQYCLFIVLMLIMTNCAKAPEVVKISPPPPQVEVQPTPQPELTPLDRWQMLVRENRYASIDKKLESVNEFFNQFEFAEDLFLWGKSDYWATLIETLTKSSGDCEDFTIAKYFTLRNLNVPDESMRITYVMSLKSKAPHMVLTLRRNSTEEPIVLDTNNNHLSPISRRQDLVPVYSFNSNGYWIAKKEDGWDGKRLGDPSKLSLWASVLERMNQSKSGYSDG